jgi:co-chaperonin GroES (HSP10)
MTKMIKFEGDGVPVEKLPIPCGWRILIGAVKLKDTTDGGIKLLDSSLDIANNFRNIAKVLAVGNLAFDDPSFRGGVKEGNSVPWCKVGDVIVFNPHDGANLSISHDGEKHNFKFINDRNVVSLVTDLSAIEALL